MVQVDRSLVLEHLVTKSKFEKQLYNNKTKNIHYIYRVLNHNRGQGFSVRTNENTYKITDDCKKKKQQNLCFEIKDALGLFYFFYVMLMAMVSCV